MAFKIAGLVLSGIGALAGALAKFMTKLFPIPYIDEQGNNKILAVALGSPIKVEKNKEIGLVIVGSIEDSNVEKLEKDIEAGIAIVLYESLKASLEKKIQKGKAQMLEYKYEDYSPSIQAAYEHGILLGKLTIRDKYIRQDIKKTTKAKGIGWGEDNYDIIVAAKEDKYNGIGYAVRYSDKGTNKVIPMEAIKIWQHVRQYKGEKPDALVAQLYSAAMSNDKGGIKEARKQIKEYIKEEAKKFKE